VPKLQLLYWEVLYNAVILRTFQQFRPPTLMLNTTEWHREGIDAVVSRHLNPAELARVAAAYGQIESYRLMFGRSYLSLFSDRVRGDDQKAMENLASFFVDAEKALRRTAFSYRDFPSVTRSVEVELNIAAPAARKPFLARTHGAILGNRDIEQIALPR